MTPRLRIDADLTFGLRPGADGGSAPAVTGTITADGRHITLRSDDLGALSGAGSTHALHRLGGWLARQGLTLSLCGPRGSVVTIGAVRSPVLHRVVARSRHVHVDDWREAWRIRPRSPGARGRRVASLLPPPTPTPVAPTFGRIRSPVTTTHDPQGGGRPQLVLAVGATATRGISRKVFRLAPGVTTIGSGPDCDLRLGGLAPLHAEIVRDVGDEYVLGALDPVATTRVNGAPVRRQLLRSGARIQLGEWKMSYWRAEHADHGRPFGGREGGELSHQRPQPRPSYDAPPARD